MDAQSKALTALLRCELTAVNQQFTHVLALHVWGEGDIAARIMQVDEVDFSNAMRILGHLIETAAPFELAPDPYRPGGDLRGVLLAEQAMELRLSRAIAEAHCTDRRALALVETARTPRQAYATWLAERLAGVDADGPAQAEAHADVADLVAHLVVMIEQAMAHAFVHWHAGDAAGADAAWAASGGAMMQLTSLVRHFAAQGEVPAPGAFPELCIARRPEAADEADRRLAALVAAQAAKTAQQSADEALVDIGRGIAEYSREQSLWAPGRAHPATRNNPPAFASFEATLHRFDIAD